MPGAILVNAVCAVVAAILLSSLICSLRRRRRFHEASERALRESERLLRDIIDGSTSIIFLKDREGRFITANKRMEDAFGMRREELRGKTLQDILPKDRADRCRASDLEVLESGRPAQLEEVLDFEGAPRVFLTNKFPLFGEDGRAWGLGTIATDITERKRAEETLADSERLLRDIMDSSPVLIYLKDREGRILAANAEFEKALGVSEDRLLGKTDGDLFPADSARRCREDDLEVMRERRAMQT